jgi:predicted phage terminase large subunit-like protein
VVDKRPTGSKEVRAMPFAAACEAGLVELERGDWNRAFIDELCAFPTGQHDDQVDAAADAFNWLAGQQEFRWYS